MVTKLNEQGTFPLTPIQAGYGMGLGSFIGAIVSPFIVESMTRRGVFIYGRTAMWCSMFAMGILNIYEQFFPLYLLMCLYNFIFLTSDGAIIWLYINEVTVDSTAGLMVFGVFSTLLLQTMTFEAMLNSAMKPEGVFFFFGAVTLIGHVFIWAFFEETTGLTDKEKK